MENSLETRQGADDAARTSWTLAELWPFLLAACLAVGFLFTRGVLPR